jgi:hypothetical protein
LIVLEKAFRIQAGGYSGVGRTIQQGSASLIGYAMNDFDSICPACLAHPGSPRGLSQDVPVPAQ